MENCYILSIFIVDSRKIHPYRWTMGMRFTIFHLIPVQWFTIKKETNILIFQSGKMILCVVC